MQTTLVIRLFLVCSLLDQWVSKVTQVVLQPVNLTSFCSISMCHMGNLQITLRRLESIPETTPPCCLGDVLHYELDVGGKWQASREREHKERQMIALLFFCLFLLFLQSETFLFSYSRAKPSARHVNSLFRQTQQRDKIYTEVSLLFFCCTIILILSETKFEYKPENMNCSK